MDGSDFTLPHAPLRAAPSSSFVAPSALASLSLCLPSAPNSKPDYVTHLASLHRGSAAGQLLALTSGGHCHLVDKQTLQRLDTWAVGGGSSTGASSRNGSVGLTNVATMDDGSFWGVTDRKGVCTIFDARSTTQTQGQSITIDTPTNSALLSLAFSPSSSASSSASSAPLIALGHELQSVDAPIYVYDLRNPAAPVVTYDQSHSDDVTFLDLSAHPLLLSGGTDGLMTVFDISRGTDEDDAVLSATNTGSSIARGGWQTKPPADWRSGLWAPGQETTKQEDLQNTLGRIWAVSDMQTVGVWDAGSTDSLLPPLSALPPTTLLPSDSAWKSRQWETDYIIDAFARPQQGLCIAGGDQAGAFSLISVPEPPSPFCGDPIEQSKAARALPWTVEAFFPSLSDSARGGHEDIVRALVMEDVRPAAGGATVDSGTRSLVWSGGEDGKIVLWDVSAAATGGEKDAGTGHMSPLPEAGIPSRRQADVGPSGLGRSAAGVGRRGGGPGPSPGAGAGGRFKPYG
ncbi:unnamed protein product [Parajaminaea phylloscopi]